MKLYECVKDFLMPYYSLDDFTDNVRLGEYSIAITYKMGEYSNEYTKVNCFHIPLEGLYYTFIIYCNGRKHSTCVGVESGETKPMLSNGYELINFIQNLVRMERMAEFKRNIEVEKNYE